MVKIALAQVSATADYEANLKKGFRMMEQAKRRGALIICFPEMAFRIFFPQYRTERKYFEWAEIVPGPTTERFQQKAKELGLVTIINLYERAGPGEYYDCSPVIDVDGSLLGISRMMHIAEYNDYNEKYYYRPGNTDYPVFQTKYGNIGVAICYDRHFPEVIRTLAVKGAEIIFIPSAYSTVMYKYPYFHETVNQAHSALNGVYMALINRVGREEHMNFMGRSFITDPRGAVIARANDENDDLLLCDLDLEVVKEMRDDWLFFRDRRPETYYPLTQIQKIGGNFNGQDCIGSSLSNSRL